MARYSIQQLFDEDVSDVEPNILDVDLTAYDRGYGTEVYVLNKKHINALFAGKALDFDILGEYSCLIKLDSQTPNTVYESDEYKTIQKIYSDQVAQRSGVPLINHINEGLEILKELGADDITMRAYCLHPLFQSDGDLQTNYLMAKDFDPLVVLLALEYRRVANLYLCKPETDLWTLIEIKDAAGLLLPEVRNMLIADKRQNQKDFLIYHKGTHPRSEQLDRYFKIWLEFLKFNNL